MAHYISSVTLQDLPTQRNVHIIWDIENVQPPKGKMVYTVSKIREEGMRLGRIQDFTCFYVKESTPEPTARGTWRKRFRGLSPTSQRDLQNLGVDFTEIVSRKPEAADKFILTQLLKISLMEKTNPTFSVILISGDSDFSRALCILNSFGIHTRLIHNDLATEALKAATTDHISWSKFLDLDSIIPEDRYSSSPMSSPSPSSQSPPVPFRREYPTAGIKKEGVSRSPHANRRKDDQHQKPRSGEQRDMRETPPVKIHHIVKSEKSAEDPDLMLQHLRKKVLESQKQRRVHASSEEKTLQHPVKVETISLVLPPPVEYPSDETEDCIIFIPLDNEPAMDTPVSPTLTLASLQAAPIIPIFASSVATEEPMVPPALLPPSRNSSPVKPKDSTNEQKSSRELRSPPSPRPTEFGRPCVNDLLHNRQFNHGATPTQSTRSPNSSLPFRKHRSRFIPGHRRVLPPRIAMRVNRMPTENGTSSSAERLSIEEIFTVTLRSLEKDHQPPYEDVFRDRMNRLWGIEGGCLSSFERFLLAIQDRGIAMLEGEKPYRLLKPIVSASSTRGTPDEGRCIEERKRGIVETRFSSLSDGSSSGAQMKRKHEDVAASHRRRSPNVTRTTTTSSPLKRYKRPRICPDYRRQQENKTIMIWLNRRSWRRRSNPDDVDLHGSLFMECLPAEAQWHIFSFLDQQSLCTASAVCKLWNELGNDEALWKQHWKVMQTHVRWVNYLGEGLSSKDLCKYYAPQGNWSFLGSTPLFGESHRVKIGVVSLGTNTSYQLCETILSQLTAIRSLLYVIHSDTHYVSAEIRPSSQERYTFRLAPELRTAFVNDQAIMFAISLTGETKGRITDPLTSTDFTNVMDFHFDSRVFLLVGCIEKGRQLLQSAQEEAVIIAKQLRIPYIEVDLNKTDDSHRAVWTILDQYFILRRTMPGDHCRKDICLQMYRNQYNYDKRRRNLRTGGQFLLLVLFFVLLYYLLSYSAGSNA